MTGIFINSENLSRFEIKKQIRSLTNGYNSNLLIDLYKEFNSFSVWELMKINSRTKKKNELEFKSNYIEEEGFVVDFFPKTEYKIVSGIIRKVGHEEFRLDNLNFDDYQDFLNLTFDFSYCFNEIVKSINQIDAGFDGVVKHDVLRNGGIQSSIDFFRNVNQNLVSELDIINFIDETTTNELPKLELLKKDLEAFEVNFTTNEVVESLLSDKVYNSKSISELLNTFKEIVLIKIEKKQTEYIPENQQNPFPLIFSGIDNKTFTLFETFTKEHVIDPYVDFSFIFQQMKYNGYISDIKHVKFMNWLKENQFINDKEHADFIYQNSFRSLRKCAFGTRVDLYLKLQKRIILSYSDKSE